MNHQFPWKGEQLVAQSLRSCLTQPLGQRTALEHSEEVEGKGVDAKPRGVSAEARTGQYASAQFVFQHTMHMLDRAGLLAVPAYNLGRLQIVAVAYHRVVADAPAVKQLLLQRGESQCDVA